MNPAYDREILQEIFDMDPSTYTTVIDSFCHSWTSTLEELRQLHLRGEAEALARAVHKLKGGSRTIGLVQVGNHAHAIERCIREGQLDRCAQLLCDLATSGSAAVDWLCGVRTRPPC